MNSFRERLGWWFHHPIFELIYLLDGTPNQHRNVIHYRNIAHIMDDLTKKMRKADEII